ncbi:MAG: fasciclin domain-containing protein [Leptolyngbya sp.]|nr:fasciclin domain-containing protein [Candidatus Melainabacteria bacterium]
MYLKSLALAVAVSALNLVSTTAAFSADKDIVDTAVSNGKFQTLVKAIGVAGLAETLKGKGPFTVFAPDDAAFAKVPKDALNDLLADKAKLTKVLTYHVVSGDVSAKQVQGMKSAKTLEGSTVAISVKGGKVKVNNATVTTADVKCSNGVIHIVDTVLMPE